MATDLAVRSVQPAEDRPRTAQAFRRDFYDSSRYNYDNPYASDQGGPGPTAVETTPPRSIAMRSRLRYTPQSANRTAQEKSDFLTAEQTINLFAQKIEEARKETQDALAGPDSVPDSIRTTLTIDLGRSKIKRLPDAIVDLIIVDVERLSLSHNMLRYIPDHISDCNQLRYLNIRSNDFNQIPPCIFGMPLLEILDVSKNKIPTIPPEIRKLESLRVFSIVHNKLSTLPVELAELQRLKVLKVAENPFEMSIKRIIHAKEVEVAYSDMQENEKDTALTAEILKHLKAVGPSPTTTPVADRVENAEPTSAVESVRPARRALSGRFPVVPAAIPSDPMPESPDVSSHPVGPPSLPTKSHLRRLSGQSTSISLQKRPGIAPMLSGSERNRSNSESVVAQVGQSTRQRRMGAARRHGTELDSIDETKVVRQSHLRGLSYGSVLKKSGIMSSPGAASSSPSSPRDVRKERPQFVKILSSLPEQKSDLVQRPIIQGAKGILYAIYQVHPQITSLVHMFKGRDQRKSGLEMVWSNVGGHFDKLNRSLLEAYIIDPDDEESSERAEEIVNSDCATLIKSYAHVVTGLRDSTYRIISGLDAPYLRSFMLLLYGTIVEVRNAITKFGIGAKHHRRQMSSGTTHPIATIPEETTPETPERSRQVDDDMDGMTLRQTARYRSGTVLKAPPQQPSSLQPVQPPMLHIPQNLNSTQPSMQGTYSRAPSALGNTNRTFVPRSRSNSQNTNMTNADSATVVNTADSYNMQPMEVPDGRVSRNTGLTDAQEEHRFELIFLALTKAYETALQAVPIAMQQLQKCIDAATEQRQSKDVLELWNGMVVKSRTCLDLTQALQLRLTSMKLKDSGVGLGSADGGRHDPSFWNLCKSFLSSFVVLVNEMKLVRNTRLIMLPQELVAVLRPVQKACQEAGHVITSSPWNYMLQGVSMMPTPTPFASRGGTGTSTPQQYSRSANNSNTNLQAYSAAVAQMQNQQSQYGQPPLSSKMQLQAMPNLNSLPTPSLPTPTSAGSAMPLSATSPMPATPLSAALGAAAQATVPSTPASSYADSFFKGDVFQRADSLMSMPQAAGVNFLNRR